MTTPRVFIIRHGETEWSLNGRHTGTTELPLTANGEKRILATGQALVGDNRLIVPAQLSHMYRLSPSELFWKIMNYPKLSFLQNADIRSLLYRYVSPRRRAQRTLELLGLCCAEKFPWQDERTHQDEEIRTNAKVQVTGDIREWDYGDYEGLTSAQIREQRKQNGEAAWDIWRDGCPGGEYVQSIVAERRKAKSKKGLLTLGSMMTPGHREM